MKSHKIVIYFTAFVLMMNSCNQKNNASEKLVVSTSSQAVDSFCVEKDSIEDCLIYLPLKKIGCTISAIGCSMSEEIQKDTSGILIDIEQMPTFVGGDAALMDFIKENIKYPEDETVEGRVVIKFIIDSIGNVQEPTVVRSLSTATDKEALRIIKAMPRWTPGKKKGRNASIYYTLPIRFQKQNNKK